MSLLFCIWIMIGLACLTACQIAVVVMTKEMHDELLDERSKKSSREIVLNKKVHQILKLLEKDMADEDSEEGTEKE